MPKGYRFAAVQTVNTDKIKKEILGSKKRNGPRKISYGCLQIVFQISDLTEMLVCALWLEGGILMLQQSLCWGKGWDGPYRHLLHFLLQEELAS